VEFQLSIQNDTGSFIKLGFAKPTKSGKAWQLTIFADKAELLQKKPAVNFSML